MSHICFPVSLEAVAVLSSGACFHQWFRLNSLDKKYYIICVVATARAARHKRETRRCDHLGGFARPLLSVSAFPQTRVRDASRHPGSRLKQVACPIKTRRVGSLSGGIVYTWCRAVPCWDAQPLPRVEQRANIPGRLAILRVPGQSASATDCTVRNETKTRKRRNSVENMRTQREARIAAHIGLHMIQKGRA